MRADRLIALLLLLQQRGRITAAEAAAELEVSERTARRDLEALAMSGVPVYSTPGRGGGWQLIGGASTDLTGLSADETQALFLAAGPALVTSPQLRSALRKLTSALPETFRAEADAAASAIKVDAAGWGQVQTAKPRFLDDLTDAVVGGYQLRIDYDSARRSKGLRIVHPLGLVTKRNTWYLVAGTADGVRTFRVSRVRSVEALADPVMRPADFDLDQAWEDIVTEVESLRTHFEVRALIDPEAMGPLRWLFGRQVTVAGTVPDGRLDVRVGAQSARAFAGQVAGLGAWVELLDPPTEIVDELRRIARELQQRYPTR